MDRAELAAEVTQARYLSGFRPPITATVTGSFLFLAAILGGYLTILSPGLLRSKYRYLFFLAPLGAGMLTTTARAPVLDGGLMFVSGLVLGAVAAGRETRFRLNNLLWLLVAIMLLSFSLVFAGQLVRWSSLDSADLGRALEYTRAYLCLHMSVLGYWCREGGLNNIDPALGCYTFGGVAELLGIMQRKLGIFDAFPDFGNGVTSNIYTAFRCVIEDYTTFGAFVFFAIFSSVAGVGYVILRTGRHWGAALVAPSYHSFFGARSRPSFVIIRQLWPCYSLP